MSIEQMKLLSIVGKEENMDKFISEYLLNSGMQPEDVLNIYDKGWKLSCYSYNTIAKDTLKQCKNIMDKLQIKYNENYVNVDLQLDISKITEKLGPINEEIDESNNIINNATENIDNLEKLIAPISRLGELNVDLKSLYNLKYIKFRYGKIKRKYFERLEKDSKKMDIILFKIAEERDYIWIIYFTTEEYQADVDSYLNILDFERIYLPDKFDGIPRDIVAKINATINDNRKIIQSERIHQKDLKAKNESILLFLYRQLEVLEKVNDIKKYLVHDNKNNFYIVGWIPVSELNKFLPKLIKEHNIKYEIKNPEEVKNTPPTYLKNNKFVRIFETIVEMYGTPNYKETDPTLFVAITAFIMFGFMFGDVGQGLIIAIIGFILYRKNITLGPVILAGGVSSTIFGFLYGSIFGKEEIIPSILISPMKNITTMLICGIVFGIILILIAMVLNIRNGIKNHDIKKIFLSENGLAGFLFYIIVLGSIGYFIIKRKMIISVDILIVILIILLLIILFKDNIINFINRKRHKMKIDNESSFLEKVFEIIEMLLSMISNTISFVRLAAFAINHVGLCMAVYILSNMVSGTGSILIMIIGNIIVIGLEGLIVGIQVLRLEYYELFSRFYQGDGIQYKPIRLEDK